MGVLAPTGQPPDSDLRGDTGITDDVDKQPRSLSGYWQTREGLLPDLLQRVIWLFGTRGS